MMKRGNRNFIVERFKLNLNSVKKTDFSEYKIISIYTVNIRNLAMTGL